MTCTEFLKKLDFAMADYQHAVKTITLGNCDIEVRQYLPVNEKINFLQFIVENTIDQETGTFSPIRVNVYYSLAILKFYCGLDFSEDDNIEEIYDILEYNGIFDSIFNNINDDEKNYIFELVEETIEDIDKYNSSAAGIIKSMAANSEQLSSSIDTIMGQIQNKEGLELLDQIKNVVGND